jgi:hypothetical protein
MKAQPNHMLRARERCSPKVILGTLLPQKGKMDISISSYYRVLVSLLFNLNPYQYVVISLHQVLF